MAGIDFKTIAEWMGHQDGGVLLCKVYSHLLDSHKREMAAKLVSAPAVPGQPSARGCPRAGSRGIAPRKITSFSHRYPARVIATPG